MSDFFGLWACGAQPLNASAARQRAWAALASFVTSHDRGERASARSPRCWLSAPISSTHRGERSLSAHVGFLIDADEERPRGHVAMARIDEDGLSLWRSLSGGERVLYARLGDDVWFASSLKVLLAHPEISRRLHLPTLAEVLLTGRACFGNDTLTTGIQEVMAGEVVRFTPEPTRPVSFCADATASAPGSLDELARQMFDNLTSAVVEAAGPSRPVPVALSGGIDSSAVIASAVEAFGADQITALTYEFDDEEHPVETDYARMVCEHFGITDHQVFSLSRSGFLDRIPEMVWRSESLVNWPKTFMLEVAEKIAARGFDRYLTGFGFGSHMSWMKDVGEALSWLPIKPLIAYWRHMRFERGGLQRGFHKLHPALEPPHPRIFHFTARQLHHVGLLDDLHAAYPEALHPLIEQLAPIEEPPKSIADGPLSERLQRMACSHLLSCIDVSRTERPSRQVGAMRIAPGHFVETIPTAYFPALDTRGTTREERELRPGKLLLRRAYGERLPGEVIYRIKSWADAVASDSWIKEGRALMCSRLLDFPTRFDRHGAGWSDAICYWEPHSILATSLGFHLWDTLIDAPAPPTWEELSLSSPSWF